MSAVSPKESQAQSEISGWMAGKKGCGDRALRTESEMGDSPVHLRSEVVISSERFSARHSVTSAFQAPYS